MSADSPSTSGTPSAPGTPGTPGYPGTPSAPSAPRASGNASTSGDQSTPGTSRADLVADTALALLAERGMRGLTHRAVDEAAGLPPGSTSNVARTREALLELAVRRHAEREARVLALSELPDPRGGADALAEGLALAVHRSLTRNRALLIARYELALEATRRPGLRAYYDRTGAVFKDQLTAMLTAAGSPDPARQVLSLVAWADGLMFSCAAGSFSTEVPDLAEIRAGLRELLTGMLRR
ncbi:TetR/AcrR family transcriptional regulator [Streptomyces sp. SP2-10]|uniref:TetR/AcrR family transcriptional regulator n=1 Tax=Streptomyces sp. SP2-10 TaxID=2873385 RepID=UPI001CA7A6F5|nr:TetR/AcrR family transcriptional regulator [Streptomyces sp. SP2-10]MBY8846945.1 TetR/AcrR family transcriptional regulator [Streptomyces sp. SP2-10]